MYDIIGCATKFATNWQQLKVCCFIQVVIALELLDTDTRVSVAEKCPSSLSISIKWTSEVQSCVLSEGYPRGILYLQKQYQRFESDDQMFEPSVISHVRRSVANTFVTTKIDFEYQKAKED